MQTWNPNPFFFIPKPLVLFTFLYTCKHSIIILFLWQNEDSYYAWLAIQILTQCKADKYYWPKHRCSLMNRSYYSRIRNGHVFLLDFSFVFYGLGSNVFNRVAHQYFPPYYTLRLSCNYIYAHIWRSGQKKSSHY